jgi:hypothetical protein
MSQKVKVCSPVTGNGDNSGYSKQCSGGYKQSKLKPFFQPQNFAKIAWIITENISWQIIMYTCI